MVNETRNFGTERLRSVSIVGREALNEAESEHAFSDFYHQAMVISWPTFFAATASIFLLINCCFAGLYMLGEAPIANQRSGNFLDLFFFSVETLATVGGNMYPQTTYAHLLATAEIFTGLCFLAVMTGLIFTRISRPKARLVFSRNPVVTLHDGQQTLMFRVANARLNVISDASAQLWLVRDELSREGESFRRFHRMALIREENPVFVLSWTLMHAIDEASPLWGQTMEQLANSDANFVLVLTGLDEVSAQELRARQAYDAGLLRWGHRYVDILGEDEAGRTQIDYARFHDVEVVMQEASRPAEPAVANNG